MVILRTLLIITLAISFRQAKAQNWMQTTAPSVQWKGLACSRDGTKVVAITGGQNAGLFGPDLIYLSSDSGASWAVSSAPSAAWNGVASSLDGSRIIAVAGAPARWIYTSTNSGATWVSNNVPRENWATVASSA